MTMASVSTQTAFDYSALVPSVAEQAREVASAIRARQQGQVTAILETGRDLIRMKEILGHGHFSPWLESEFGWDKRTAQRYMGAATEFSGKSDTVSYLPPTTLYQLAAASTPSPVREQVVQRLAAGERIEPMEIRGLVKEAKEAEKVERAVAKMSPVQKKSHKRAETAKKRADDAWREERDRRLAASESAANMLRDGLGVKLAAFVELFRDADLNRLKEILGC